MSGAVGGDEKSTPHVAFDEETTESGHLGSSPFGIHGRSSTEEFALHALAESPFFELLRPPAIATLARSAYRHTYLDWSLRETQLGCEEARSILLSEGQSHDVDALWVIETGSVQVLHHGELLGHLESGAVFGEAVALGLLSEEPFTVQLSDDPLVAWRVQSSAVQHALSQSQEARQTFEKHMDYQVAFLLAKRIQRLVFFAHCSAGVLQHLVSRMKVSHYRAVDTIIHKGHKADHMLLLVSGGATSDYSALEEIMAVEEDEPSEPGSVPSVPDALEEAAMAGDIAPDRSSSSQPRRLVRESSALAAKGLLVGRDIAVWGDSVLLGNGSNMWPETVYAMKDSLALILKKDTFAESMKIHPAERKHYKEMSEIGFREMDRCGRNDLYKLDLFKHCSDAFRTAVGDVSLPKLFASGVEIIAEGHPPPGLLLMMSGVAEEISNRTVVATVHGPMSHGAMQCVSVSDQELSPGLRAKTMCQVLVLQRDKLLECLRKYPGESTKMVIEQSRRVSAATRGSWKAAQVQHRSMWHVPLCRGCSADFVSTIITELELSKLIPGQPLFQGALHFGIGGIPYKTNMDDVQMQQTFEQIDFIVVLLKGEVEYLPERRGAEKLRATSPMIAGGLSAPLRGSVVASVVCEVHRLSFASMARAASRHPKETRRFITRVLRMQKAQESQHRWAPANTSAALQKVENFEDSTPQFQEAMLQHLETEVYLPGDVLVKEGDPIDSTLFLECGAVTIERVDAKYSKNLLGTEQIGQVSDGFWIGDLAMFAGVSKRRATIRALTVCKTHRLQNADFILLLTKFPAEGARFRELAERKFATLDKISLEHFPFFKQFSRTFLNNLRSKCRPKVYFANEVMMSQGEIADSLCLLGKESNVVLEVNGIKVKEISGMGLLGTKALLSPLPVKRASTVITKGMCTVHILTRDSWLEALTHDPSHRLWLGEFTKGHLQEVRLARKDLLQKLTANRNMAQNREALRRHCSRMASGEEALLRTNFSKSTTDGGMDSVRSMTESSIVTPRTPRTPRSPSQSLPTTLQRTLTFRHHGIEEWDCFNGMKAAIPSLQLPPLAGPNSCGQAEACRPAREPAITVAFRTTRSSSLGDDEEDVGHFLGLDPGDAFSGMQVDDHFAGSFMLPPTRARTLQLPAGIRSSFSRATSAPSEHESWCDAESDSAHSTTSEWQQRAEDGVVQCSPVEVGSSG
mmetsp:Transcript_29009/g.66659  ORF Transcript_29009/g.66659 Transcript_29009/m.66659 type:complete len:1200 (+) Transcript_29009:82-3681(+)